MFRPVRLFSLGIILLAMLTVGAGCRKGLSVEEQQAIQPVTLTYWTVFNDINQVRSLAQEYQQLRPYVNVNIRQVRQDEFDNLLVNALADDVPPDVVSIHNSRLPEYRPRLATMPGQVQVANLQIKGQYRQEESVVFNTYAMPSRSTLRNSYVEAVENDVVMNGRIYGLPMALDTLAIYYNKDLLNRAGIAVPPATWEELLDAVQKTTRFGGDGRIVQSGIGLGTGENIPNAPDIFATLLMQKGIDISRAGTVTFANNAERLGAAHPSLEVLRFYTDFARPTKEAYSWNSEFSNAFTEFIRGRSAFYIGFAYDQRRLQAQAPQLSLGTIALPQLNETKPVNVANYWVESVVKKSPNQQIAWDFVRFLTSEQSVKTYTDAVRQPSPLRVHLTAQLENERLAPFASSILTAKTWFRGTKADQADQAFRTLIDEYLKPYPQQIDPAKRDTQLLLDAARRIQQSI